MTRTTVPAGATARKVPFWLRRRPTTHGKAAPTPREARWWIGVVWLIASALLLGLVAHVTIFGSLQHARNQEMLYQQLRVDLAKAVAPLGQLDLDAKLVAPGTPLAIMTIPEIGVNQVIVEGTSSSELALGPGHRRDTVMPGQQGTSVIMGRQTTYGGPFSAIARLVPGDTFMVTTGQGVAKYTVFGVRRDGDPLPESLAKGEGRIELITADGVPLAPTGAVHVDAQLMSKVQETPSRVFSEAALSDSERLMGTEPDAGYRLMFWALLLLASGAAVRWSWGRWGRWQTWIVGAPLLLVLAATTADAAAAMLPNLL